MLRIGITGGIGSGKTTVCKLFETLGIPVYYADDRAKWLMQHLPILVEEISEKFGAAAYDDSGNLDRTYLAEIVFKDNNKLKELEAIVHPRVFEDGLNWYNEHQDAPYTLRENALLFETGSYKMMDKTITVYAPKELRIARVISRDKTTKEAVEARMDKQMAEEEKLKIADYIVHNDQKHSLIKQVYKLHHTLLTIPPKNGKE